MQDKLLITITILFLSLGSGVLAQEKTLNVFLERNSEQKMAVDLVFENNSTDTIFVSPRFDNLTSAGRMPTHSGIAIDIFRNGNLVGFRGGPYPSEFRFLGGTTIIYPHSSIRLFFDIGNYFPFHLLGNATGKVEVGFFMNYTYIPFGGRPQRVIHFRTNRVTIVEPMEDVEKETDCENGYEN